MIIFDHLDPPSLNSCVGYSSAMYYLVQRGITSVLFPLDQLYCLSTKTILLVSYNYLKAATETGPESLNKFI